MMKTVSPLLLLFITLLSVTGCTTAKLYSGNRPDSEVAIVSLNHAVQIFRMNNKGTPRILQQAGYNFSEGRVMKLLPGSYAATCGVFEEGWSTIGRFEFPFSVEAGKRYYLGVTGDSRHRVGLRLSERK